MYLVLNDLYRIFLKANRCCRPHCTLASPFVAHSRVAQISPERSPAFRPGISSVPQPALLVCCFAFVLLIIFHLPYHPCSHACCLSCSSTHAPTLGCSTPLYSFLEVGTPRGRWYFVLFIERRADGQPMNVFLFQITPLLLARVVNCINKTIYPSSSISIN